MKGLVVHAVLALLGLVLAYQTWTRPAVTEEPIAAVEPVLLDCKPEQLERLELDLPTHAVDLAPAKGGEGGPVYWITSTPAASKADEGADAGASSSEPELRGVRKLSATEPVTFRGNERVALVLADLLPLRPLRDLGKLDPSRDAEFGFDKADTAFKVTCGGRSIALTLAGRTYGNNDSYARDQKTGKTYLLRGAPFTEIQSAQYKLMQNDLHAFQLSDVDEAQVKAGERTRKLLQRDRAIKSQAQWVDADKADQRNEAFGNWLERVGKLRARKYLARGQAPGDDLSEPHGPVQAVLEIDYKLEGKPRGRAEIVRVDGEKEQRHYYAKSETSEVWVKLFDTVAKEVETDLPLIVGEAASSSEPPPAPTK